VTGNVKLRRPVLDDLDLELTNQIREGATPGRVGEEKQVSILFADICDYTSFVEALPAYDVMHVLNRYFYLVNQVVSQNGGYIDTYLGDGLMAVFGVEDSTKVAFRAVKAGLEMFEALERLNEYLEEMYGRNFQIRVGIHYGEVVVGTIHVAKKIAVVGDTVNLASRVETANKKVGTRFLISEDAHAQVREEIRVKQSFRLRLPGRRDEQILYEVVGLSKPDS
jgi:class 3 adenylate cyclase